MMKIFISWSGERSQALAKILHERLPYALQYLDPWLSQSDIEAGERWAEKISKQLEECTFGITCLTAENVSSPWILFESGALAKSMQEGQVIPLLLDLNISDVTGPLAQFQAKKAEKSGILDVIGAINKVSPTPVLEARLKPLFDALWPDFEKAISEIPKGTNTAKRARPQGEVLEELVDSVRNLDGRYREIVDDGMPYSRRKRNRFHPMMLREMIDRMGNGKRDPISILVFSSIFREDFPWIYELGLEFYKAVKSKKLEDIENCYQRFKIAIDMVRRGPFGFEEIMDKRAFMLLDDMEHFINFDFLELNRPTIRRQPTLKPSPNKKA